MKALAGILATLALATTVWARGGGGCFEAGTPIQTSGGPVPIESLRVGDEVLGGRVAAITPVMPAEYLELPDGVRVTAEHPFQIAPGIFQVAAQVFPAAPRVPAVKPAYNLLVSPSGTYITKQYVVHNKGCFLPETPILRMDGTALPISAVRPGQQLLAFELSGNVVTTTVNNIITHDVDEYLVVQTEQVELHVTVEHPFYVGHGTFKTLAALQLGDEIYAVVGQAARLSPADLPAAEPDGTAGQLRLTPQRIRSITRIRQLTRVYNLQTDAPNTYFANGIAVHNKGGGGCFPAGTPIATPRGSVAIEALQPGDVVLTGQGAVTVVEATFRTRAPTLTLTTDAGVLRTTVEHPVLCVDGRFRRAGELAVGARLPGSRVTQCVAGPEEVVFNLRVGAPHTFVANGFVVHNKGGGGGFHSGGYHGRSSGRPMTAQERRVFLCIIGGVVAFFIVFKLTGKHRTGDDNLDFCYSRNAIEAKSAKTRKLLEFIMRVDTTFTEATLRQTATQAFMKLQECWQAREYAPMQALLLPDLYRVHCSQLAGLRRNHEINLIEGVRVTQVDVVNVRYPHQPEQREFTALITAMARDYYVDDRTRAVLRGDETAALFQEFWTFQWQKGRWLLREIEQTRESDVLKDENFFEPFTDKGTAQVAGAAAGQTGPIGPWLEQSVASKATRIERMLNFLVQTDKLWNRQVLLERARQVFLSVMLAREAGGPTAVKDDELFPSAALDLRQQIAKAKMSGLVLEYRNLCVRKVDLVQVCNFADNRRDEFCVRISAHAQQIVQQAGAVVRQDEDVTPFTQFWVFGRHEGQWKLKEVLPDPTGEERLAAENVDEGVSQAQVQWYYRQTRAN